MNAPPSDLLADKLRRLDELDREIKMQTDLVASQRRTLATKERDRIELATEVEGLLEDALERVRRMPDATE